MNINDVPIIQYCQNITISDRLFIFEINDEERYVYADVNTTERNLRFDSPKRFILLDRATNLTEAMKTIVSHIEGDYVENEFYMLIPR